MPKWLQGVAGRYFQSVIFNTQLQRIYFGLSCNCHF